ncbi:WxL domain-containing protein [Enterococcus rivorum]|nr:WxL domain-containing protein [Enterococcus rivorum]MBP2099969.1 hypothetical protein [Enterococcus rivorum]
MNINKQKLFVAAGMLTFFGSFNVEVNANDLGSTGTVTVEKSPKTAIVDPEHPQEELIPENSHSTEGALRIDSVSDWNFGKVSLNPKEGDLLYYLNSQRFLNSDAVRGSHVQITDNREAAGSWTLQVKQNSQFKNSSIPKKEEQELNGATFSLDKIWVNSIGERELPTVTRDTIAFQNFDQTYNIAHLEKEKGQNGTWLIVFGASATNEDHQENTLKPELDLEGNAVVDEEDGKPIYRNEAISIRIPKKTKIHPVTYETTFTWILGDLP